MIEARFVELIAKELGVRPEQVAAAIPLFDKGATVPFVARYRKDVTGNLDEVKLEKIEERNSYFSSLINRRDAVLENIEKQGKLTDELREKIMQANQQAELEDLYMPFKKQRRTRAAVAREQGLEPLADFIWSQTDSEKPLQEVAAEYVNMEKAVRTPEEALLGAQNILAERVSVDPDARTLLRKTMLDKGELASWATKNAGSENTKFEDYYDFKQPLRQVPSHRLLAVLRGVRMGMLRMDVLIDDAKVIDALVARFCKGEQSPYEPAIRVVVEDAYKRLLRPAIENEVMGLARAKADEDAIRVFRENAEQLLLAPPAGNLAVLGVDPGLKSGIKLAVVDTHGKYLESATIHPFAPENDTEGAEAAVTALFSNHQIQAVAIGNGTGSREAGRFISGVLKKMEKKEVYVVFVNEAGASVYSASPLAREEFPDLDITIRGAISIARRFQDPLAELVKIEPKSVGVGQYQHDVNQRRLREGLTRTVESCVNRVGVDINTASPELLRYVSGIQMGTAQNIVEFRGKEGGFKSRQQLTEVSGIGEKTFEQCAGFLRVRGGDQPLDGTGIHPECYPIVEQMAEELGLPVPDLVGHPEHVRKIDLAKFTTEQVGALTLDDIRRELSSPGRDPRETFQPPKFLEGVESLEDLKEGMVTEGVITNVTDFGAFVDIGVHQDGLIHLSELSNRFVRDPRELVRVGEVVRVQVLKVDQDKKRISLSRKALFPSSQRTQAPQQGAPQRQEGGAPAQRGEGGDRGRPRREGAGPARSGGGRPQRSQDQGSRRDKPRRGGDRPKREDARPKSFGSGESMNTTLADQLAALKDKFKD